MLQTGDGYVTNHRMPRSTSEFHLPGSNVISLAASIRIQTCLETLLNIPGDKIVPSWKQLVKHQTGLVEMTLNSICETKFSKETEVWWQNFSAHH